MLLILATWGRSESVSRPAGSDEDDVGTVLAGAMSRLVDPRPLAVTLWRHGRPPSRQLGIDAVPLASVAEVLAAGVHRAQGTHPLT